MSKKYTIATDKLPHPGSWMSGTGVIGWKRVMSGELFKTRRAAEAWARKHGLKDVRYVKASMEKNPRNPWLDLLVPTK